MISEQSVTKKLDQYTCKTERYPETKRKNTSAGNPMYMGQVDTAMYQADHETNLRSKVQQ